MNVVNVRVKLFYRIVSYVTAQRVRLYVFMVVLNLSHHMNADDH